MYGGRVIDDFDRRIVQTYMDEYMGDFLFDASQPFHFYHNEHVDYAIPEAVSRQEFIGEKKFFSIFSFYSIYTSFNNKKKLFNTKKNYAQSKLINL